MTLGERIKQARMEAGLSQRQLAGENMTRNMLSALEHDGANPSVATLKYLSERLCKPISYFLGEDVVAVADLQTLEQGRTAYAAGNWGQCLECLKADESIEGWWLKCLSLLELAKEAIHAGRFPYGKHLLKQAAEAGERTPYFDQVRRRWILLLAKTDGGAALAQLRDEDEVLLLRAEAAMANGAYGRAQALLEAVEGGSPRWALLMGEVLFGQKDYEKAVHYLHKAEEKYPDRTGERLEICYRELGDYKKAYYYATRG